MDESLDVQIRHGGTLSNWAVRRIGRVGFEVINMLPIPSLINHLIRDIPVFSVMVIACGSLTLSKQVLLISLTTVHGW
jgi:hypothetical protein